jgi:tetratricopeptide (TPR) repeat protein
LNPVGQLGQVDRAPLRDERGYDYFSKKAEDSYRGGHYKEAAALFSELIERYPNARAAYLRRGDCFGSLQEFDLAIADFEMAIRLLP